MDISFKKDVEVITFLKESIKSHNDEVSYYHKISRDEDYVKPILITEKDKGRIIGGISASMYWEMIYLDEFFIKAEYRKKGIGRKLLNQLIDIAKEKHVNFICLQTFSFQARDFYLKFGFKIIGEIKDYPPGESMYTMRLDLK
ncbi:MAG: GNAT family N-acetyltransferase [Clostridia bacterium]|nr:GNAT family N-acetyltransferase [Clostridia bacterium]